MFEGWENYYLMIGSSAGALIGLMFVVVTLTAGRDRAELERGKHLYTSPIVWHLAVILTLSGAAAVPKMSTKIFGIAALGLAILGFGWGIRSAVGIARRPGAPDAAGFDMFWYGLAPANSLTTMVRIDDQVINDTSRAAERHIVVPLHAGESIADDLGIALGHKYRHFRPLRLGDQKFAVSIG